MFRTDSNRSPRRSGLTLIELLVVLTILIALAALVVPMMPGMLSRSHDASAATNIGEISKVVQTYNQLYFSFPNNLDNLAEPDGSNVLASLASSTHDLSGQLITHPLGTNEVTALSAIGINSVAAVSGTAPSGTGTNANTNWSPTFYPYTTSPPTSVPLAGTGSSNGATVAILSPTGVAAGVTKLGLSPTGTYVVFGFGIANSAVGKVIQEAPVHFPDQQTISPALTYQRYGLIFKVSDTNTALPTITSAQFVGTVCLLDDGIESAGDHIQDFFNRATQQ
jgi:type II secretory pathway pseudopilin PulG